MKFGMRAGIALGALAIAAMGWQVVARAQEKGGENETGPYDVVAGWPKSVGSSRVDLQACKLEYSIVSPK